MSWLIYFDCDVVRYNGSKRSHLSVDIALKDLQKSSLFHNHKVLVCEELDAIWYRRPYNIADDFYNDTEIDFNGIVPSDEVRTKIKNHHRYLKDFIFHSLPVKKLGSYSKTGLNKLDTLLSANRCGLDIPDSIITNNRNKVVNFLKKNNSIICKPIGEGVKHVPKDKDYWISNKTILIEDESKIPNQFDVSLFQECLDKKYELRIFYLDGNVYSACIFSQTNEKTKVDFRNYDFEKPNRIVPYNLETEIKKKLDDLMSILGLNTGSIDLVKTKNGRTVFLEVNPVGQYDFISQSCNYNIDGKIAEYLIGDNGKE